MVSERSRLLTTERPAIVFVAGMSLLQDWDGEDQAQTLRLDAAQQVCDGGRVREKE